jgi:hypothetical protein
MLHSRGMKSLTLILVLLASPAAWAEQPQQSRSLNELISFFSSSPLSGLASPTASTPTRRPLKGGRRVERRDVGRAFLYAKESGRGISVQPFGQQMNTPMFRGPGR